MINREMLDELLSYVQTVYQDELEKMSNACKFDHDELRWTILNRINKKLVSHGVNSAEFTSRLMGYIALVEPEILDNDKYCGLLTKCIAESGLPFGITGYSKNNIMTRRRIDRMKKFYPQIIDTSVDYLTGGIKSSLRLIELVRGSCCEEFLHECACKWSESINDDNLDVDDRVVIPIELRAEFGMNLSDGETYNVVDTICDEFETLIIKAGEDVILSDFYNVIDGFTAQLSIELKISELYTTSNHIMSQLFGEWESSGHYKLLKLLHNKLVTSLSYSLVDSIKTSSVLHDITKDRYINSIIKDYLTCVLNKEVRVYE